MLPLGLSPPIVSAGTALDVVDHGANLIVCRPFTIVKLSTAERIGDYVPHPVWIAKGVHGIDAAATPSGTKVHKTSRTSAKIAIRDPEEVVPVF